MSAWDWMALPHVGHEDDDGLREYAACFISPPPFTRFQQIGSGSVQALRCAVQWSHQRWSGSRAVYLAPRHTPSDFSSRPSGPESRRHYGRRIPWAIAGLQAAPRPILRHLRKGRKIVENGTVTGVAADDLEQELRQTFRAALPDKAVLREACSYRTCHFGIITGVADDAPWRYPVSPMSGHPMSEEFILD